MTSSGAPSTRERSERHVNGEAARGLNHWESPEILPNGRGRGPPGGVGQLHPMWPLLWGWWSHMHNHAFDPGGVKR